MKFEMYGTSMINGGKSDIQSTPDNSNLQEKQTKILSYWEFELSKVKLCRKCSAGKWKLLWVSLRHYQESTVCILIMFDLYAAASINYKTYNVVNLDCFVLLTFWLKTLSKFHCVF